MCMLSFFPPNVQPDVGRLTNGTIWNRDGHGFAIISGKQIIIRKSFDHEYLIAEFVRLRALNPSGPALFHSRLATHGSLNKANVHPFRVGRDRRTIVAHNGILPLTMQPKKGDKRSDTRLAADEMFDNKAWFGPLREADSRAAMADFIGHNKLVFLTVNPKYDAQAYIINEDLGEWADGVWYSNADYRDENDRYGKFWDEYDAYDLDCVYCGELGKVDPQTGYCMVCDACADCFEQSIDCQCYMSAAELKRYKAEKDAEEYEAWWAEQADKEQIAMQADDEDAHAARWAQQVTEARKRQDAEWTAAKEAAYAVVDRRLSGIRKEAAS